MRQLCDGLIYLYYPLRFPLDALAHLYRSCSLFYWVIHHVRVFFLSCHVYCSSVMGARVRIGSPSSPIKFIISTVDPECRMPLPPLEQFLRHITTFSDPIGSERMQEALSTSPIRHHRVTSPPIDIRNPRPESVSIRHSSRVTSSASFTLILLSSLYICLSLRTTASGNTETY